jgi:hypothetical protein
MRSTEDLRRIDDANHARLAMREDGLRAVVPNWIGAVNNDLEAVGVNSNGNRHETAGDGVARRGMAWVVVIRRHHTVGSWVEEKLDGVAHGNSHRVRREHKAASADRNAMCTAGKITWERWLGRHRGALSKRKRSKSEGEKRE